jgi:chemotaxis protein CheC
MEIKQNARDENYSGVDSTMILSESQKDILQEIANIGVSRAAVQLSQLLQDEISLRVPEISCIDINQARALWGDGQVGDTAGVYQDLHGFLSGRAHLIFQDRDTIRLVEGMLGGIPLLQSVDMREYEFEALKEIGNIVISSCIAALSELLGESIQLTAPAYTYGSPLDCPAIKSMQDSDVNFIIQKTELFMEKRGISGVLVIVLTMSSVQAMLDQINCTLGLAQGR